MDDNITYRDLLRSENDELGVSNSSVESRGGHYEYESLNEKAPDTFRLLLLEPGNWNDPLNGSLFVARQSDGIGYAALSYLWGETQNRNPISIDGRQLSIGANLYVFLKHLRHPVRKLTLWTDAVCIDQENLSERGHQVRLMGDIYRSASNVYAWLGEDSHGISELVSSLSSQAVSRASEDAPTSTTFNTKARNAARFLIRRGKSSMNSAPRTSTDVKIRKNMVEFGDHYGVLAEEGKIIGPPERKIMQTVLADLCQRPYWMRTWIVQEILLARSVIICLGHTRILWKDFSAMIDSCALRWPNFIKWNSVGEVNMVRELVEMTKRPVKFRYSPLEALLGRYNHQMCLDARDRIYALLSLATGCDTIIPDYTQNRLDLFFQLKDIVRNHFVLRSALDLQVDEIKYRADTLRIPWTENDGEISFDVSRAAEIAGRSTRKISDGAAKTKGRAWPEMSDGYTHWGNAARAIIINESHAVCEKHQIVRALRPPVDSTHLWKVKLESGVTGLLHAKDLDLWIPTSGRWERAEL